MKKYAKGCCESCMKWNPNGKDGLCSTRCENVDHVCADCSACPKWRNRRDGERISALKKKARLAVLAWLEEAYGKRCKAYSPGCANCEQYHRVWELFREWYGEYAWPVRLMHTKKKGDKK